MIPGLKSVAAACVWSLVASLPTQAAPVTTELPTPAETQKACLREARGPIENSAAYRHADVRGKTQLRNAYRSQVRRMERVCRGLTATSQAERRENADDCQKRVDQRGRGTNADALIHADRMKTNCDVLRRP